MPPFATVHKCSAHLGKVREAVIVASLSLTNAWFIKLPPIQSPLLRSAFLHSDTASQKYLCIS